MAFINTSINDSSAFEPTLMIKWHSHSVNNQIGQLPRQTLSLFHHFVHNFLKTKKIRRSYLALKKCARILKPVFVFSVLDQKFHIKSTVFHFYWMLEITSPAILVVHWSILSSHWLSCSSESTATSIGLGMEREKILNM